MGKEKYEKLSDEELVARYQEGDNNAADFLVEKYKNLVRMKARSYFLVGADSDDLLQEGMIGLYKAIRDYNPTKKVMFMPFASLCIGRQIRTAVTTYNRMKNSPLNNYVSFDAPVSDENSGESACWSDVLEAGAEVNPEAQVIEKDQMQHTISKIMDSLSPMERQVMELYLEGYSYSEIAVQLDKKPKAIDNAIQRMRTKIELI